MATKVLFGVDDAWSPAGDVGTGRQLRSGIIGTGFMGAVHAHAVRVAGGRLTFVAGGSHERTGAAVARLRAEAATSAEGVINSSEVDVVHICTPNHTHAVLARKAIAAGKHVVCEKPLALEVTDAEELTYAAAEAGVVAAVPFAYRYYPTVREARARIAEGSAGTVHLLHGSYLQDWLSRPEDQNWRVEADLGGRSRAFADIGIHWCDLAEYVTGHRIVAVSAQMMTAFPRRSFGAVTTPATEDIATLQFRTDKGALGSLVISQVSPGRKNRLWLSVDGTQASVVFNQEAPESLWVGGRDMTQLVVRGPDLSPDAAALSALPPGHPQGFQDCFNAFVADVHSAVTGHPAPGMPTFSDGLRAARLTEAVLLAAHTGEWQEVPA